MSSLQPKLTELFAELCEFGAELAECVSLARNSTLPVSEHLCSGRSFLLTGKSFLLTVGLCCLRSIGLVFCTYGLVFFAYGGN